MADKFCDTNLGAGNDDGSDWYADAFQSIKGAIEAGNSAGDMVWYRRSSSFDTPTSDIAPSADGAITNPIQHIAWPRASVVGTLDFENGSTCLVDCSITPSREKHTARMIKNNDADNGWYFLCYCILFNNTLVKTSH